jgi:hypothetical protein
MVRNHKSERPRVATLGAVVRDVCASRELRCYSPHVGTAPGSADGCPLGRSGLNARGVAPAALGFAAGLQGGWDWVALLYFVCCGVSRLALQPDCGSTFRGREQGSLLYWLAPQPN